MTARAAPVSRPADALPSDELAHATRFEWWHVTAHVASPRGPRIIAASLVRLPVMGVPMLCGWLTEVDEVGGAARHVAQTFVGTASQAYRSSEHGFRVALSAADDGQLRLSGVAGCYRLEAPGIELYLREGKESGRDADLVLGGTTLGRCDRPHLVVSGVVDEEPVAGHGALEHHWGEVDPADMRLKTLAVLLDSGERVLVLALDLRGRAFTQATLVTPKGAVVPLGSADLRERPGGATAGRAQLVAANLALDIDAATTGLRRGAVMRSALPGYWEGRSEVRGQLRGRAVRGVALTERIVFESVQAS